MTGKTPADLILTNGYVITMDADRRIIADGAVAISGGAIVAVGKTSDVLARCDGPQHDCGGGVVHPGLIDAHEHLCLHITRGWEPDTFSVHDTWTQFEAVTYPAVTDEEEVASVLLATLEMAQNGVTAFSDTGSAFNLDAVMQPAGLVGVRGIMGWISGDMFPPELAFLSGDADHMLRRMEDALSRYGSGRVRAGAQLCGMGDCSDELVLGAKALARKYGQTLFMHQCVTPEENELYLSRHGCSAIRHLSRLGVLDESTALVHMIHLSDDDLRIFADSGASAVHCPAASIKYGMGAASAGRFPEMCAAGVNIALGTDSGTWSDRLDVLHLTYLAATLHRESRRSMVPINSYRAFEMATIGGAKALGMQDEIGSLEPGKRADIVLHTTQLTECTPAFDPFTNLIYSARSKSVRSVLVDGEFIVKDGRAVKVDEERVRAQASAAAFSFAKRTGYTVKSPWPIY